MCYNRYPEETGLIQHTEEFVPPTTFSYCIFRVGLHLNTVRPVLYVFTDQRRPLGSVDVLVGRLKEGRDVLDWRVSVDAMPQIQNVTAVASGLDNPSGALFDLARLAVQ